VATLSKNSPSCEGDRQIEACITCPSFFGWQLFIQ
jgi:hypothetical protein